MLGRSVSFKDDSVHLNISSINSERLDILCYFSGPSSFLVAAYFIVYILLLLPLCIVILHHGFQRRQKQSATSSRATMSHSDFFTYHISTIQMICVVDSLICCIAIFSQTYLLFVGTYYVSIFTWFGEVGFNVLTCVERYLAVVHPITYLNLKNEKGIRMRKLSVVCVWLLGFFWAGSLFEKFFLILTFCVLSLSITTVFFCSISVLCVLLHPGPGDQDGGIKKVSQSKLRNFYTIISILMVLIVWFVWCLVSGTLFESQTSLNCLLVTVNFWFNLPGSVILPLLFLHRKGKLVCSKKAAK